MVVEGLERLESDPKMIGWSRDCATIVLSSSAMTPPCMHVWTKAVMHLYAQILRSWTERDRDPF